MKYILKDKPKQFINGQYEFEGAEQTIQYENSLSVNGNDDKFVESDLYTFSLGHQLNENIIEGNLPYVGDSFVQLDSVTIKNTGVNHKVKNTQFRIFIFDRASYNPKKLSGNMKSYNDLNDMLYKDDYKNDWPSIDTDGKNSANKNSMFYNSSRGKHSKGWSPNQLEDVSGEIILNNLNDDEIGLPFQGNKSVDTFDPKKSFSPNNDAPSIFSTDGQENNIYIVVWMKGDGWRWRRTKRRKKVIQIFEIQLSELFTENGAGKITPFVFTLADSTRIIGGGGGSSAFKCTDLQVTFNTLPGVSIPSDLDSLYLPYIDRVEPKEQVRLNPESIFNLDFINISPNKQMYTPNLSANNQSDFNVISTIKTNNLNIQNYYFDDINKQITSTPAEVNLNIYDAEVSTEENYDLPYSDLNRNLMFFVVNWNDVDNKYSTWTDVIKEWPATLDELYSKQDENLYKVSFKNYPLKNVYTTPGIKTIKYVVISYYKTDSYLVPVRWKLMTSKIFLNIPVSEYSDFGEVGGQDFTTIPWPYTTPIIGGISENSNYKNSLKDTLGGGKIGNSDLIDSTFLEEALKNDELGQNIKNLDLQQVRYFNKSYDMHKLLGINPVSNIVTEMQDFLIGESFSDDGPKYIAYDEGTNRCRTTYENPNDLNNDGDIYDYLCASEYPDVGYGTTGGQDTSGSPRLCCYKKFDIPVEFLSDHKWVAETCGNNGIIDPQPPGGYDYVAYECRLHEFEQQEVIISEEFNPYTDISQSINQTNGYWDGETNSFSEESSVGQIFISDNSDLNLISDCQLELNNGNLTGKSIDDSSGNGNKGLLIGDYKIKKTQKNRRMKRDSFIKVPKKDNKDGAL